MPRSLVGQMVLLLGTALMVAQLINFALILNERQFGIRLTDVISPAERVKKLK